VLPIDWNIGVRYARLVLLAESIPPGGDDGQLKLALMGAGYTFLATLYGNELLTDSNPHAGESAIMNHLTAGDARTVTVCGDSLGGALATLLTVSSTVRIWCRSFFPFCLCLMHTSTRSMN